MKQTGHIEITDKVEFVYYEMVKPKRENYYEIAFDEKDFNCAMDEYEASKRSVEVSNGIQFLKTKNLRWIWLSKLEGSKLCYNWVRFKNNQPCKAEVTGDKATIIELL